MRFDEKSTADFIKRPSTVAMVFYRLIHLLVTPLVFIGAFVVRIYRAIFWSDARWMRYRLLNYMVHNYLDDAFSELTEEEIEQVIGIDLRLIAEKEKTDAK